MKRNQILYFVACLLVGLTYNSTLGAPGDRREDRRDDRREDWRDDRRDDRREDWRDDRRDDRIERRVKKRIVRRILRRHVFTLPPHHTVIVINGFNYYFWDGVYYYPYVRNNKIVYIHVDVVDGKPVAPPCPEEVIVEEKQD